MSVSTGTTEAQPKITFYTNHGCGWSHRVHIALKELGLAYDEVLIDLDHPREDWFLELNPRGVVPVMRYTHGPIDHILTESALITQFLMDAHPSHLLPEPTAGPTAPLERYGATFFIDTYFTKVNPIMFKLLGAGAGEAQEAKTAELIKAVGREIEPLLADANPFFGGSKRLTFVEVQTSPFVLRLYALSDGIIFPKSLAEGLDTLPHFSKWAKASTAHESVTYVWDQELRVTRMRERLADAKAKYAN